MMGHDALQLCTSELQNSWGSGLTWPTNIPLPFLKNLDTGTAN